MVVYFGRELEVDVELDDKVLLRETETTEDAVDLDDVELRVRVELVVIECEEAALVECDAVVECDEDALSE